MSKQIALQSVDQLMAGAAYRVETSNGTVINYPKTKEIIQPWLDKVSKLTNEFSIKAHVPSEVSLNEEGSEQLFFPRVLIEAKLPAEYDVSFAAIGGNQAPHRLVQGFLYGLDSAQPKGVAYVAYENSACTNLQVFSPVAIMKALFSSQAFPGLYDFVDQSMTQVQERKVELEKVYTEMHGRRLAGRDLDEMLGILARKAHRPGGMKTAFSQMMELITVNKAFNGVNYFSEDGSYTPWQLYQAFTAKPSQTFETLDRPDRVLQIYKFFSEN